jgi:HlyD family secretion protein
VDDLNQDGTAKVRSILSTDTLCLGLLFAIAQSKFRRRDELFPILRRDDWRFASVADEELDERIALLESAKLVEQNGRAITITPLGTSIAAQLETRTAPRVERAESSATVARAHKQTNEAYDAGSEGEPHRARDPGLPDSRQRVSRPAATPLQSAANGPDARAKTEQASKHRRTPAVGLTRLFPRRDDRSRLRREEPGNQDPETDDRLPFLKYAQAAVVVAALLIGVGWSFVGADTQVRENFRFATAGRGDLQISITATGRIAPIDAVEVSSQLSGQVVELFANFNDKVAAGAPLARLDDKTFAAAVAEAAAGLAQAKASFDSAAAATAGDQGRYEEAKQDEDRANALAKNGRISAQELDGVHARVITAQSELDAARAEEEVRKAAIDMAESTLRRAKIDLERTVIRSPIDGVIIGRSVELGQTVAVSMEAPTLFTIAHDLRQMHVNANVDEADIGQIRVGQSAQFSVDAYPGQIFEGRVVEIHRAPETVQNVVTYTVVVTAENPDLSLFPGMTAVVRIVTADRQNVLLVPNAALRFNPDAAASEARAQGSPGPDGQGRAARVWVRAASGDLSSSDIGIGMSDGSMTEVLAGHLTEGESVAIGKEPVRGSGSVFGLRLGF